MLISVRLASVSVICLSCLVSAFSTLFVTEGAVEEKKMEEMETRIQKMEVNNVDENHSIVKTIPFVSDIFTKAEDVMNLTPLKVATIISGQHLLNTVRNMPQPGNQPQDTINMLSKIVDEFNKTTQIIKLTAEYVNISSNYILSSLNKFAKSSCNHNVVEKTMKTINRNFLEIISNRIKLALTEITEKTMQREMTGSDVLVSSAYHIVAAFQEMTNKVMSLAADNNTCDSDQDFAKAPPNSAQIDVMENNQSGDVLENVKQDASHRSIKKDQALTQNQSTSTYTDRRQNDALTTQNINQSPGLNIQIFSPETPMPNEKESEKIDKQTVKIPKSLKVAFLTPGIPGKVKNTETRNEEVNFQSQKMSGTTEGITKVLKENPYTFEDTFPIENTNSNQEFTIEVFSPQNLQNKRQEAVNSGNEENNLQNLENLQSYYKPLKTFEKSKKIQTDIHSDSLKIPESLKDHYYPMNTNTPSKDPVKPVEDLNYRQYNLKRSESIKQTNIPFKQLPLFENLKQNDNEKHEKVKGAYKNTKSSGTQTSFKESDDKLTTENFHRQDITMEVFSPESFIHSGKDISSIDIMHVKQNNLPMSNHKNYRPLKPESRVSYIKRESQRGKLQPFHNNIKQNQDNNNQEKNMYEELASAHDSLANVFSVSPVSDVKTMSAQSKKSTVKKQRLSSGLASWSRAHQQFLNQVLPKNQPKENLCDESIKPVCGIDRGKNNFIIFLNDCQRQHHNSIYNTGYEWTNMDKCVRFLLKYSSANPSKFMNIRKR